MIQYTNYLIHNGQHSFESGLIDTYRCMAKGLTDMLLHKSILEVCTHILHCSLINILKLKHIGVEI